MSDTVFSIYEMTDQDLKNFQDIVLRDVKNKSCSDEDKVILSNNLDIWLFCLRNLRKEIELQLTQFKANTKAEAKEMRNSGYNNDQIEEFLIEENKWRNNAIKFLTAIERKTLYVKLLINES